MRAILEMSKFEMNLTKFSSISPSKKIEWVQPIIMFLQAKLERIDNDQCQYK